MFQERYNRIILPFFFLSELFIFMTVYFLATKPVLINAGFELLLLSLIWALPSSYFRSYRAPRTY